MLIIMIIAWILGTILAYPMNKKWRIRTEREGLGSELEPYWTRADAFISIILSFFFWYFVILFAAWERMGVDDWFDSPSKF